MPKIGYQREDSDLTEVVHTATEYMERVRSRISADDSQSAWHELQKLKTYLERALCLPDPP